jgi:tRNA (Thr-GGU) A37 N-methylase
MNVQLIQIGSVEQDENGFYIQLSDKYKKGLTGLEGFTHLNVLWWGNL